MKIAVMSDVHANTFSFKTALDDARLIGCDQIWLLGDIVGYGYDPLGCV